MISDHPGLPLPVAITRLKRARRLRLRVDHAAGLIKLTIPWRTSQARALAWAAEQQPWVAAQLDRAPDARPFADGATVPLEGRDVIILHQPGTRRGVTLAEEQLLVGGPESGLSASVERWLRDRARHRCSALAAEIAAEAGVRIASVSVGDATTRWGSCAADGALRFSWRLILAPPQILRFVVAHEVAHRLHMDHSPAFKAAEERLVGQAAAPLRSELRRLGPSLRAVGRR